MQARHESPSPILGEGLGRGLLRDRARDLRRNATEAERHLWHILRAKRFAGWKFRRQYPVGAYIADIACPAARLVIEADGGQHADNDYDARRDDWFKSQGWVVLRFWNNDILVNEEGVLTAILAALGSPLPNPSPARGEGLEGVSRG